MLILTILLNTGRGQAIKRLKRQKKESKDMVHILPMDEALVLCALTHLFPIYLMILNLTDKVDIWKLK